MAEKKINVLILGSGGREHALAWKVSRSPRLKALYSAPGSSALLSVSQCRALNIQDGSMVVEFCAQQSIDLVIVGPEAPLANGVTDALRQAGVKVFGPARDAARLESSKAFAKDFMSRHKLPTAAWEAFDDFGKASRALAGRDYPLAVKADGLASGKGVRICADAAEAKRALEDFMERRIFGKAGTTVVLEDGLEGPELSVMALVDGKKYVLLPSSRDHKRLKDGDQGPNTGGMGAYAPVEVDAATAKAIKREILDPAMAGLIKDKVDYRGVLYVGLMLTAKGPKVLEFNCRFGDPEAQTVLPLLKSDILELALACAEGALKDRSVETFPGSCVCVTLAASGYPDQPRAGQSIRGLEEPGLATREKEALVFHAGTRHERGKWLTAGGRVLSVCGRGKDVEAARANAYAAVSRIKFEGRQCREDIALQEAKV